MKLTVNHIPYEIDPLPGETLADLLRERLGLTQAQVAKQACLASEVYGRIERGGMMPVSKFMLRSKPARQSAPRRRCLRRW